MELQLKESLHSSEAKLASGSESGLGLSKVAVDGVDSSAVTKKLEEELLKRDALIEVCYILTIEWWEYSHMQRLMLVSFNFILFL